MIWASILIGCLIGLIGAALVIIREIGKNKFICYWKGHTKPVFHISRAFWWCGRCGRTLGLNEELWTPEAMAEYSELMRRPDRN